ncbi:spore coat protein [Marinithermofilum abyssi]|uniref:Spore coat protein n=1 Tax=Marinithermofilum abyssi TaxID=1571185 RepID=A0A8J2VJK6_9BACL|nr:spore coat protein [Marinithermofilum abyssi]GGE29144.1 spore coat protein [Marinithermofilum abyssi]
MRLAWHETLELHELVASQAHGLTKLKKSIRLIPDPELQKIYRFWIQSLQNNLQELLPFYRKAPQVSEKKEVETDTETHAPDVAFYAGELLGLAKSSVRNYAAAITETATPQLRQVLTRRLIGAIQGHGKIFYYMYKRSLYPAYDLNQLLAGDVRNAIKALSMPY